MPPLSDAEHAFDAPPPSPPPERPRGPYPDAAALLGDHLRRVALSVERLRWAAGAGGFKAEQYAIEIAELDAHIAERLAQTQERAAFPLERLRAAFGLSPHALQLLAAAAASGLALERARDPIGGSGPSGGPPDVAWLIELLALDPTDRDAYFAELLPGAPLLRWRLVRLGPARGWAPEAPLLLSSVAVPQRIHAFLKGRTRFDPAAFDPAVQLRAAPEEIAAAVRGLVARALHRRTGGRWRPAIVVGAALTGKAATVTAAAAEKGLQVIEVDLEGVMLAPQPADLLADVEREARLQDAAIVLRHGEVLAEARPELRRAVIALLGEGAVPLALTSREDVPEIVRRVEGAQVVRLGLPTRDEQRALWRRALPDDASREPAAAAAAPDNDLSALIDHVVERYRLTPGDILAAGSQASQRAALRAADAPLGLEDLVEAVRGRLRHRLGDIAELIVTPLGWSDLVLRDDTRARIDELLASVKHRATVMDEWGFARKVAYGRAVSALFSGPPGTGKTMVATLIAKELGLELFRVDLSRVVSKWVGETEKNLGRAFDEAQSSQAVLLFDEADALFAKRTEVKSSNDRYANLEVNYLLQRLESFEGIVVLTTNHQTAVDDAFKRRLRFRVEFPNPDEDEREQLWRAMLPPGAPIAGDVDFRTLGRKFAMAGGYIKNAVVRAAYLAAGHQTRTIDHKTLLRAATLEWEDMGNLAMM